MVRHLIHTVKFDFTSDTTAEAKMLQDKVFALCRHNLSSLIENVIEEVSLQNLRLDEVIIDLGAISKPNLDSQLLPALKAALLKKLQEYAHEDHPEVQNDPLEVLIPYLEHGTQHWSTSGTSFEPIKLLNQSILHRWTDLFHFLKATKVLNSVVQRLTALIDLPKYKKIVHRLQPSDGNFIIAFSADVEESIKQQNLDRYTPLTQTLWMLVILDLVKNHDALFNRKMFIKRQLLVISATYRLDYVQVLRLFEEFISKRKGLSIPKYSLPYIIKDLWTEVQAEHPPSPTPYHPEIIWNQLIANTKKTIPKHEWEIWMTEYFGEFKTILQDKVQTTDQIDTLIHSLSDPQAEDVVELIADRQSEYILAYKHTVIHEHKTAPLIPHSESSIKKVLNTFILLFLLIDRGSSFNQKTFLRYQLIKLSKHYNLTFDILFQYLLRAIEANKGLPHVRLLVFIKELQKELHPPLKPSPLVTQWDRIALLEHYLKTGLVKSGLILPAGTSHQKLLINELNKFPSEKLSAFISSNDAAVKNASANFNETFFLIIIEILFVSKLKFTESERKINLKTIKKALKQAINPGIYKRYALGILIGFDIRLKRSDIEKYELDHHQKDPYSLLARFFAIKLSLSVFYQENNSKTTETFLSLQKSALNFQETRSRIIFELSKPTINPANADHQKQILRVSFLKILESHLETEMLLHQIDTVQVQKLIETLTSAGQERLLNYLLNQQPKWKLLIEKLKGFSRKKTLNLLLILTRSEGVPAKKIMSKVRHLSINRENELVIVQFFDNSQKKKTTVISSPDEHQLIQMYLLEGILPDGTTLDQIEFLLLKYFSFHYTIISKILNTSSVTIPTLNRWCNELSSNILHRIIQSYAGRQYNQLTKQFTTLEKLADLTGFSALNHLSSPQYLHIRLHLTFEYQHLSLSFHQIVRYYLSYVSKLKGKNLNALNKEMAKQISLSPEPIKSHQLESVAKQLEEFLNDKQAINQALPDTKQDAVLPEEPGQHFTRFAGLVLFWPFLKRLFDSLDYLTKEGLFQDTFKRAKAVILLQYVADGIEIAPEHELTLHKILCGMPFSEPMNTSIILEKSELEMADSMISGLIQNWDKIGNTSVEGLRNSFIRREGSINKDERNWTIRVEKKGIDIILDYLPWALSGISFPWLEGMIYVEWR